MNPTSGPAIDSPNRPVAQAAVRFVVLMGIVSLFADFTYEGARSITGPFLAVLGASALVVGVVAGLGEFLGYGLRLVSGPLSERTGAFWLIALFGYFVQLLSVPALAFARTWPQAAALILCERAGKAIRNPPRDVMLSHAATHMGYGWGFGLHEAFDQAGALIGPLAVAAVLAHRGQYQRAFAVLLIPALISLALLAVARIRYPKPGHLDTSALQPVHGAGLPRIFWVYLAGAGLAGAGFADFALIAYHFQKSHTVPQLWIPVLYSIAMGASGLGSLIFGKLFDRAGIWILLPLTPATAIFAPLVFLGGFGLAVAGVILWGIGMGVSESIIPAAVATMVPAQRRPSAYGIFTAGYGFFWLLGSAAMGALYQVSRPALVIFCVAAEFAAIPVFLRVRAMARSSSG